MNRGTPADRAVLDSAFDGMDEERQRALERDVQLATFLRLLSHLSRAAAHDLKQPLHTMGIYLELLRTSIGETPDKERAARCLEVLASEIQNAEFLLDRFVGLTRLGNGTPERLDLAETVDGILKFLEPHRRHASVEIVWEAPGSPVPVSANRDSVRQALMHLFVNAIDAAAKEEVVRIQVLARDRRATLLVTAPARWGDSIQGLGQENGVEELLGQGRGLEATRRALRREHATLEVRSGASRPTILEVQMPLAAAEV